MTRTERVDLAVMLAILAIGSAITIAWGERIGIHRGEGWDGEAYAAWARDFPRAVIETRVTAFQAGRVLPSALVYCALSGLGVARSGPHVIVAFQIWNALALCASAVLLFRIAQLLVWSRWATWGAYLATFLGFANARVALYYPTETDPTAFLLAMATVWAYLARRAIAQWVIALATAFTWPALLALGLVAIVLPRPATPLPVTTGRWHRPLAVAIALATAALIALWLGYEATHPDDFSRRWVDLSHHDLWIATIACVVISSSIAAFCVARERWTWSLWPYLCGIGVRRIAAGIAAVTVILVVRGQWIEHIGTRGPGFTWQELRSYYGANALRGPLWNLVHHVVYFGPIVLLAIASWSRIAATVVRWGPVATLTLGMIVLAGVNTDARHLLHLMPFAIVATVCATADRWTPRRVVAFCVLSLAWSKLWWPIGYNEIHDSLAWPDLRWFMHDGPHASDATFLAHLAGAVLTAIALWLVMGRGRFSSVGRTS